MYYVVVVVGYEVFGFDVEFVVMCFCKIFWFSDNYVVNGVGVYDMGVVIDFDLLW